MRKLISQKGFSLSEMLLAVLIISLTACFIGGGITVIKDAYLKITVKAEAQTLLSTTVSAISLELRNADDIEEQRTETNENTSYTFYNVQRGYRISLENFNENIYIRAEGEDSLFPLLTEQTKTNGLVPKLENLSYENNVFSYKVSIYYKDKKLVDQVIYIRPVNSSN